MGIFGAIIGNVSKVKQEKAEKEFSELLIPGESLQQAYKLFRDLTVFTNKRLIMVDKQGLTGKKKQYTSIPYGQIVKFSKETAGRFDLDAEIKLWVKSEPEPIKLEFRKDESVHEVYRVISQYVLG